MCFFFSSLSIPCSPSVWRGLSPFFFLLLHLCSILNTHIRSGCLAYFSSCRLFLIFIISTRPSMFFLSNNLWSFCLPGTCFLSFFFFFLPCSSPKEFIYYMSCRLGWNGLICLICAHLEEPSTLHPHPHCLRIIFPIYLQSLIWIDPIYKGLYSSLSKMDSVKLNFPKIPTSYTHRS